MPPLPLHPPHVHSRRCFWDHERCRWRCGRPVAPAAPGTGDQRASWS